MNNESHKLLQSLAVASALTAAVGFDAPRYGNRRRDGNPHNRTTAEGKKKRARKNRNKQARKSRKGNK